MKHKSGFVTIIGRPNVGKSTLLNQMLGQKVVITSDKAQTTRKRIKGIYTTQEGQVIFIDTPGINKPLYKFHEYLIEEAKLSVPDADLILFIVDGTQKAGPGEKWIVNNLLEIDIPVIMAVNKVDRLKSLEIREENIKSYLELFTHKKPTFLKVSALTGRNVNDLIKNILNKLPEGPKMYPEEEITDQNMRTIVQEIIREKILQNTHEEIPHSIAVTVESYEDKENIIKISSTIYVERDSQKGIIIGAKGSLLKKTGMLTREEIELMVQKKVFLQLFVKVKKDWRKKDKALKDFGYYFH